MRTWEHPPWYGITQFEEKVAGIFLENQKGLFLHHLKTHFRMPVQRSMISGPCQETSYTAITLNPESNFTRREKNHSLFHWNTLMYRELLIRIWMSSRRSALMIIGISMGQETCLIHGQVSLNLLYWKKNLETEKMWSGVRLTRKQLTSTPDHLCPELWKSMERMPSWRRSKSSRMKSSIRRTHENCEGSISLTRRIRNSKKPSRTRVRSWRHQSLLLCRVKLWRRIVGVMHPTKLKQDLFVFWKLMNLRECVWEIRCRIIMKTILQEK